MAHPKPPQNRHTDLKPNTGQVGDDDLEQELNTSLHDVMDLMAAEVERLQAALEHYRLSDHPEKEQLIRWHVRQIDRRQDRLSQLKQMILSADDGAEH